MSFWEEIVKRIKVYNSPVLQIPRINDRQKRQNLQRRDKQSGEGMVEMERANWSDFRQESTNENEGPHIPVIRPTLRYGCETWPTSVKDEKRIATTEMRMVRWAMGS